MSALISALFSGISALANQGTNQTVTPTLDPSLLNYLQNESTKSVQSDEANRGLIGSTMDAARRNSGDLSALVEANKSAQTTAQQQIAAANQGIQQQQLAGNLAGQIGSGAGSLAGLAGLAGG